jgi:hypothetical protein
MSDLGRVCSQGTTSTTEVLDMLSSALSRAACRPLSPEITAVPLPYTIYSSR